MEYDVDLAPPVHCTTHGLVPPKLRGSGNKRYYSKACPKCIRSIDQARLGLIRRGTTAQLLSVDEMTDCSAYVVWLEKYALIHDAVEARHGHG